MTSKPNWQDLARADFESRVKNPTTSISISDRGILHMVHEYQEAFEDFMQICWELTCRTHYESEIEDGWEIAVGNWREQVVSIHTRQRPRHRPEH
jgi:hypothetical protein